MKKTINTKNEIVLKACLLKQVVLQPGTLLDISYDQVFLDGEKIGIIDFYSCEEDRLAELEESFDILPEKLGKVVKMSDEKTVEILLIRTPEVHVHTGYSLLDGAIKVPDLVKKIGPIGAVTDHGNMYCSFDFYKRMIAAGKVPIIGAEVYTETIYGEKRANHLILLVKNQIGYENLCYIISEAEMNFYRRPQVPLSVLETHSEGLICTSACIGGEIARALIGYKDEQPSYDRAIEIAETYMEIFGDDFYLEIQNHEMEEEERLNPLLIQLGAELGIKIVAATDAHYLNKEDAYAHELLLCVQTATKINDEKHFKFKGTGYHLHTSIEFERRFRFYPEAIKNLYDIVKKINFDFKTDELFMPDFKVPMPFETQESYFEYLCKKGFDGKYGHLTGKELEAAKERLSYEMDVIMKMGYVGYFLIVEDFIRFAKNNDIPVGPGRGSAVGSMVSYTLNITSIDPLPYELLFERFLNPERVSMPDIDIDFADDKRHLVIDYVREKYGDEYVSDIITFGTLAARVVLKDLGRALNKPYEYMDKISKLVPAEPKMTLAKALKTPAFAEVYEKDPEARKIIDIAMKLEGLPRHRSKHACGKVISKLPIRKICPEAMIEDKQTKQVSRTAAFNMVELEELGLLKMDFLGLRNMSVIGYTTRDIQTLYDPDFTEDSIPVNDPYVYRLISTGETLGIFQIESEGMQDLMKKMFSDVSKRIKKMEKKYGYTGYYQVQKTTGIGSKNEYLKEMAAYGNELYERLIAAISLYRPGPMDYIPQYIEGMLDPTSIHYDTPELEEILSRTYGVIVYQEQVQQIVRKLAGYSLARGDLIRRAMGKKKTDVMNAEREIFLYGNNQSRKDSEALVPGCIENHINEKAAITIWDKMVKFAEYAFNKSHSTGYADVAIKTAFFKYYYPIHFMCHTINSVIGKTDLIKKYLNGAKKMGIEILPPSINYSVAECSVEQNSIRIGLASLKNLGKSSEPIFKERENGLFKDFKSMLYRMHKSFSKKTIEALAYSGALDEFGYSRRAIISQMSSITGFLSEIKDGEVEEDFTALPEIDEMYQLLCPFSLKEEEEFEKFDKLQKEFEFAGMYLSEHPLDSYQVFFDEAGSIDIEKLLPQKMDGEIEENISSPLVNSYVFVGGMVKEVFKITTKKKDQMAILKLEDKTGIISCIVFPEVYQKVKHHIAENSILKVQGILKEDDRGTQIIVSQLENINADAVLNYSYAKIEIEKFEDFKLLSDMIEEYPGNTVVVAVLNGKKHIANNKIQLDMTTVGKLTDTFKSAKFY